MASTNIAVPFTGQSFDITDPRETVMTMALLVAGFVALFFAQDLGAQGKSTLSNVTGLGSDSPDNDIL